MSDERLLKAQEHAIACGNLALELQSALAMLKNACDEAGWPKTAEQMAPMNMAREALKKLPTGQYVPDVDGERYRAIRDKGIAFSAWQDENGVQWAVNGRVGKDLDVLVDEELLKRPISPNEEKA